MELRQLYTQIFTTDFFLSLPWDVIISAVISILIYMLYRQLVEMEKNREKDRVRKKLSADLNVRYSDAHYVFSNNGESTARNVNIYIDGVPAKNSSEIYFREKDSINFIKPGGEIRLLATSGYQSGPIKDIKMTWDDDFDHNREVQTTITHY